MQYQLHTHMSFLTYDMCVCGFFLVCQEVSSDAMVKSFLGRVGISLMFSYYRNQDWPKVSLHTQIRFYSNLCLYWMHKIYKAVKYVYEIFNSVVPFLKGFFFNGNLLLPFLCWCRVWSCCAWCRDCRWNSQCSKGSSTMKMEHLAVSWSP